MHGRIISQGWHTQHYLQYEHIVESLAMDVNATLANDKADVDLLFVPISVDNDLGECSVVLLLQKFS